MTKRRRNGEEKLDREEILRHLGDPQVALWVADEVDSTNDEAKRHILSGGASPAVFLAESQTRGRGRMGRSFYSPADTGLYLSVVSPAMEELSDAVFLTTEAAVAVYRAILSVTGIKTHIKWVNDLYYRDRKVSGILAESFPWGEERFVILGVGINLSTEQFPPELRDRAGSLLPSAHGVRNRLAAAVITELLAAISGREDRDEVLKTYRERSMVLSKEIVWLENQERSEGVAVGIDERGALVVERKDGSRARLTGGEITLRLKRNEGEGNYE